MFDDIRNRKLKICILNVDYSKSDSPMSGKDPDKDPRLYLPKNLPWEWHMAFIDKSTIYTQIQELKKQNFDLYFNFCGGDADEDVAGVETIYALEEFNLPYTGREAFFHTLSKKSQKYICTASGIQTPRYYFVHKPEDIPLAVSHINKYPMFVKHWNGYSSIGLTNKSKVRNED